MPAGDPAGYLPSVKRARKRGGDQAKPYTPRANQRRSAPSGGLGAPLRAGENAPRRLFKARRRGDS